MMKRVVCFGEIMLRLNPPGYLRIKQTTSFEASYAGGEANVAVSLVNYGDQASFVTKLPRNDLTAAALRQLRGYGVDVSHVAMGGERLGVYFVEKGAAQRPSKVIYDRKGSAIAMAAAGDFDSSPLRCPGGHLPDSVPGGKNEGGYRQLRFELSQKPVEFRESRRGDG